ncbi:MAG TPA: agmatinase [Ktedonobacterales bacterium]|nr:agmatinase [Ktedonobacterales bacterium]
MTSSESVTDTRGTDRVTVVGVPLDENSSFLRGPALAPTRIRAVLHAGSMNLVTEDGVDLGARKDWRDTGDFTVGTGEAAFAEIERQMAQLLATGTRVLTLGGDHSISYPVLRAVAGVHPDLSILHIDAHPDLYEEFDGSRRSHACPFARIMEERLATRLVQVGIRAMNPHQQRQADRFGVEVIPMRAYRPGLALDLHGPVYVSLDLDALDPAFAPGVSHHEPGGLSVRDVLHLLAGIEAPIVGADIVEYNPIRDHADMTAMVAAKFYKELVGYLLQ